MNFLDTTIGSTHATNVAVQLYLPPDEAARVLAYLDRLQALEAAQPDPAHARLCRTQDIEDLVLLALSNATLHADLMAVNRAFRVSKVISHLNYYKEDHDGVEKRYDIKKAPCRGTVRKILLKHGYM
jgi:hypothetical protein